MVWDCRGKGIVKNISIHIGDLIHWHLVMPDRDLASKSTSKRSAGSRKSRAVPSLPSRSISSSQINRMARPSPHHDARKARIWQLRTVFREWDATTSRVVAAKQPADTESSWDVERGRF